MRPKGPSEGHVAVCTAADPRVETLSQQMPHQWDSSGGYVRIEGVGAIKHNFRECVMINA